MGEGESTQSGGGVLFASLCPTLGSYQRPAGGQPSSRAPPWIPIFDPGSDNKQIAAVLDKSSTSWDRRYMYWNITLMYLLSVSHIPSRGSPAAVFSPPTLTSKDEPTMSRRKAEDLRHLGVEAARESRGTSIIGRVRPRERSCRGRSRLTLRGRSQPLLPDARHERNPRQLPRQDAGFGAWRYKAAYRRQKISLHAGPFHV